MKIYGLTVTQPWALGFALNKRLENRDWLPPAAFGSSFYVALHGGKFPNTKARLEQGASDLEFLLNHVEEARGNQKKIQMKYQGMAYFHGLEDTLREVSREGIFAVARFAGFVDKDSLSALVIAEQHQWFFGKYGWILEDMQSVTKENLIPCRGYQKLWTLPPDVLEQVKTTFPHLEVSP